MIPLFASPQFPQLRYITPREHYQSMVKLDDREREEKTLT